MYYVIQITNGVNVSRYTCVQLWHSVWIGLKPFAILFHSPPSYPSQAVLIKKCSSRSAHLKEVFIKKCSSRGVHQELFIKKCPSRSVHQEVIIKNCSSRSAHQEVFIRKCSSRSVHQEVFIKRSVHQEVLFSFTVGTQYCRLPLETVPVEAMEKCILIIV